MSFLQTFEDEKDEKLETQWRQLEKTVLLKIWRCQKLGCLAWSASWKQAASWCTWSHADGFGRGHVVEREQTSDQIWLGIASSMLKHLHMHADITSWFVGSRAACTTNEPQCCDGRSRLAAKRSRIICVCLFKFILYDHRFPAKRNLGWPSSPTHSMKSVFALPVFMPSETKAVQNSSRAFQNVFTMLFNRCTNRWVHTLETCACSFVSGEGHVQKSSHERSDHASVKLLCRHKCTELHGTTKT